jgi:hypothetical protein
MSLINEALKKAQRLRSDEPGDIAPPMPGGATPMATRGQPRASQPLILLVSGGLVLIVLSVVITFWLANRTPAEKPGAKSPEPKAAVTPSGPAPTILPPVIKPPAVAAETPPTKPVASPAPSPAERVATSAPPAATPVHTPATVTAPPITPAPVPPSAIPSPPPILAETPAMRPPTQAPLATEPAPTASVPLPALNLAADSGASTAPPKTDERIHQFVDAIKVAGIRSSGDDSRVLMNDRVYRVNDIVERTLGVRLTKVEADALTFTDGNGATYVKHF